LGFAMRVLVLNAGSSSLKYQVIHLEDGAEQVEVKGSV
jgi:acetate kinase